MLLARLTLYLFAAGLLGFGALFLAAPHSVTTLVEVSLPTPGAVAEARGVYGGLSLGTAVFLLVCARRPGWLRPGLLALVLMTGGMTAGRLLGLLLEGPAISSIYALVAAEGTVCVLGLVSLRRLGRDGTA